ncbi:hypothetical protein GQ457_13G017440 [Hibiscus cannabinus]
MGSTSFNLHPSMLARKTQFQPKSFDVLRRRSIIFIAMTSTSDSNLYKSQSITKPAYFNGDNYSCWKNRMRLFIKSNDYQVWDVMEDGPFIPTKREGDQLILKVKMEMSDEDR